MEQQKTIRGRAWVCGDYTDSYKILPQQYWHGGDQIGNLNADQLGEHAMEGVDPAFAKEAREGKYQFIVAGKNFGGGGKSIEHPIFAVKGAKIKAVIAESVSRYFFRNAINNGLLTLVCDDCVQNISTGDDLEVDLQTGQIKNLTSGNVFKTKPLPPIVLEILASDGYINFTKARIKQE